MIVETTFGRVRHNLSTPIFINLNISSGHQGKETLNFDSGVITSVVGLLKLFIPFSRGGDEGGALLNALVTVQETNSSQVSKLERDSRRKSFIYSINLKN